MAPIQKTFQPRNIQLLKKSRIKPKKKRGDNIKKYNISQSIIKNFLIIFIFALIINKVNPIQLFSKSSEVILRINGDGQQSILFQAFYQCPDKIYLNDDEDNNIIGTPDCRIINIPSNDQTINKVKLVWNSKLVSTSEMLKDLYSLIEVDLSRFDSSDVTNMDFMFQRSNKITSINFENFNTTKVESMECTFYFCESLKELDLSSFDTSKVTNMRLLFFQCTHLKSLNIESFDTSGVKNMEFLFFQCFDLKNFTTKNFDTSKVEQMNYMFFQCNALDSLDLSNFHTPALTNMAFMFGYSEWLTSIDLSNFDTSKVKTMESAFEGCQSLTNLDLLKFKTPEVENMNNMFKNCKNLEYLDLSSFHTPKLTSMNEMFMNCESLTSLDISNFETNKISNMNSLFQNCKNLLSLNISNFNLESATDLKNMFNNCTKLDYINFQLYIDKNAPESINDILLNTPENMVICVNENDDTEKLVYVINLKICPTIFCGYEWKPKQKKILPDNTCAENYMIYSTQPNIISTFIPESTIIPKESTIIPKESTIIPKESTNIPNESTNTPIESTNLQKESQEITTDYHDEHVNNTTKTEETFAEITNSYSYLIGNENNSNLTSNEINKRIYDNIINNILPTYSGEKMAIEGEDNYLFGLSSNENMFLGSNDNTTKLSKVDLGICEDRLRQNYNLNENISLIILTYEKDTEISSDRYVQFEVYESLNNTKLNLSVCEDVTIDIYIPLKLSDELLNLYNELKEQGYNLFDLNDKFYNEICTPYKSPNGTDVLLADRVNYIYFNDETKCPSGCKLSNYIIETESLKCECDVELDNIKITKKESAKTLYTSFYDVLKYSNYKVLFCYKLAFRLINFEINKGCIIICIFFVIYLVFVIISITKGIKELKLEIAKYIFIEKNQIKINNVPFENKYTNTNAKLKPENKRKTANNLIFDGKVILGKTNTTEVNWKGSKRKYRKSTKSVSFPPRKSSNNILVYKDNTEEKIIKKNKRVTLNVIDQGFSKRKILPEPLPDKEETKFDNYELNDLEYELAVKLDKRNFVNIYWTILKREQIIIFTFFTRNDHNLVFLKFVRLIFLVSTDMAFNMFFFYDETMHKMYLDYGKYNFIQQIPQILYSTIASQIIDVFLCFLSLTDKHYYEIKNLENNNRYELFKVLRCI